MRLDVIEDVLDDVRLGKPVVIVDDRDRENEGDLMVAAEKISIETIARMIQEARGLICLSLTQSRMQALAMPLQVTENRSSFGTNFGVSFDHSSVAGAGESAEGRAKTILQAIDEQQGPADFVRPGYVFPVCAVGGGVLERRGQTEGSVDLARLAGLKPAGVICEIMDREGKMVRGDALEDYCRLSATKITSVEAIKQYRLRHELSLRRVEESALSDFSRMTNLPHASLLSSKGESPLRVLVYMDDVDGKEHFVFICGELKDECLVRVHSECLTGDVFGSSRCDCASQFDLALSLIMEKGEGALVYLNQEGRGIGLANKLRAYELQDRGLDTVDANLQLGFEADLRDYRAGAHILVDLGLKSVRLLTNNPAKVESLENFGIKVIERVPLLAFVDEDNRAYLLTKRERLGHLF